MEKKFKLQLDELVKLHQKEDDTKKIQLEIEKRIEAIDKVNEPFRKKQREILVRQGIILNKVDRKARVEAINKIIGNDENGKAIYEMDNPPVGLFARKDFENIPIRDIASVLGTTGTSYQVCQCGEVDIYIIPYWSGHVLGPYLDYYLKGDGKGHVYDWNDCPPDFNWVVRPTEGGTAPASAHMSMKVTGGEDDWNYSTAWVTVYAYWKFDNPGRFKAHVHFGGPTGPTNAGVAGDGDLLWNEGARFDAWARLLVSYNDNGRWKHLGDTGILKIASHYESAGKTPLGLCPWYWKLDHWLAKGEYSIPVNKYICLTMMIKFKTSASHDEECESGVFFDTGRELLISPVITGTQCVRI